MMNVLSKVKILLFFIILTIPVQHVMGASSFKDVPQNQSIYEDIRWGTDRNLLQGYPDGTFRPYMNMTETQFAAVLARYAYGLPSDARSEQVYAYLKQFTNHELPGMKDSTKRYQQVNRMIVARNLYLLANPNEKTLPRDEVVIDWMYEADLTKGKGISTNPYVNFGQHDSLKRANVLAFFKRFDENKLNQSKKYERIAGLEIGARSQGVQPVFGSPVRKVENEQKLQWNVHHNQYKNLFAWSEKDGKIVSLFTSSPLYRSSHGVQYGMPRREVEAKIGKPFTYIDQKRATYDYEDVYITYFYDMFANEKVIGILIHDKQLPNYFSDTYAVSSSSLQAGYEWLMFDLVNSTRVENGLAPLKWDNAMYKIALNHSRDMQARNYFSHVSPSGESFAMRLERNGARVRVGLENISSGYVGPIFSHFGLMNSAGHRKNILSPHVNVIGIGVAFDLQHKPKYTQNYAAY